MKKLLLVLLALLFVGCKSNKVRDGGSELPPGCRLEPLACSQVIGNDCDEFQLVCN